MTPNPFTVKVWFQEIPQVAPLQQTKSSSVPIIVPVESVVHVEESVTLLVGQEPEMEETDSAMVIPAMFMACLFVSSTLYLRMAAQLRPRQTLVSGELLTTSKNPGF